MSRYGNPYTGRSSSWKEMIVTLILALACIYGCKACSRDEAHMIYMYDNYVYHEESHIIYIESETGRYGNHTSYTPYYDSNGNMARYNPYTDEWEVVIQGGDYNGQTDSER